MSTEPVIVDLQDLKDGKMDHVLDDAFGPDSLGIIIIKGLPEKYQQLREKVLLGASKLAQLDEESLSKLEDAESSWLIGWSCGKEKLRNNKPDDLKGSYYINCGGFYQNMTQEELHNLQNGVKEKYPDLKGYVADNLWPSIPEFEHNVKQLCTLIIDTAAIVAQACDRFMAKKGIKILNGESETYLENKVKTSTTTKARLLHYFPPKKENADADDDSNDDDSWCGQHIDHSCLTGLTSAMFLDEEADPTKEIACPDPDAGLYIRNRNNQVVKVSIPKDCLAFQTGEALELITKNQFKAVPHYVKGSQISNVARNTLAVFCQMSLDELVGENNYTFAQFARDIIKRYH